MCCNIAAMFIGLSGRVYLALRSEPSLGSLLLILQGYWGGAGDELQGLLGKAAIGNK